MDRQKLRRDIERYGGGAFINVTQVASMMGVDRGTARAVLRGIEYIPNGKEKLYHKEDVLDALMGRRSL